MLQPELIEFDKHTLYNNTTKYHKQKIRHYFKQIEGATCNILI